MKIAFIALILIISCSCISIEQPIQTSITPQNTKQIISPEKLQVSDFVVYSQVLTSIVYGTNKPDSKETFENITGNDWLTIKKETIVPENLDKVKQTPNLPDDLENDFIEKNKSKEILRSGFDVKITHNVIEQKGSLESFFEIQKEKNQRLKAIIGLSKIGFSKDNSQSLVYVEYYNPQFGLQKKYCLITWKTVGQGLMNESVIWF